MAAKKYIDLDRLKHFKEKLDQTYVEQEEVEGKGPRKKVLSDNNLTDDLLQKIHNAGDSGFNGDYDTLLDKPKINGFELTNTTTTEDINAVKSSIDGESNGDRAVIENDTSGGVMKYDPKTGKSGIVSVDSGANSASGAKVMMRVRDKESGNGSAVYGSDDGFFYHKGNDLSPDPQDEVLVKRDISDMATKTYASDTYPTKTKVSEDIEAAKQEMQQKIDASTTAAYKPKGSKAFRELPSPDQSELGNVYNVTDSFVTTEQFVEGAGHDYPANTNVTIVSSDDGSYKYDALAGFVDLSPYAKLVDFQEVTDGDIDAMFEE